MPQLINTANAQIISEAPRLSEIGMGVVDLLLGIAAGIAVISVVVAGLFYLTSAGDEKRIETAKKALIGSIIGLVVVVSALIIINAVTALV